MRDKKLFKALILGGSLAAGFVFNSTSAMAAEIQDVGEEAPSTEVVAEQEDDSAEASLQDMKDGAEVLDGYAQVEEDTWQRANIELGKKVMNEASAYEISNTSEDIYQRATEKYIAVRQEYDEIVAKKEEDENEFKTQAENSGLAEVIAECEEATDAQAKCDAVDKAVAASNENYNNYLENNSEAVAAYNALDSDIIAVEGELSAAQENYQRLDDEYKAKSDAPELEEARKVVAETENTNYQYSLYKRQKDYCTKMHAQAYADFEAQYLAGEIDLETLGMCCAGADWAYYIGDMEADFQDNWGPEDCKYTSIYEQYQDLEAERDSAEAEVLARQEKLDSLKADKENSEVAKEIKNHKDFTIAAETYKNAITVSEQAKEILQKAQEAYLNVIDSYEYIKEWFDPYIEEKTNDFYNNVSYALRNNIGDIETDADNTEKMYNQAQYLYNIGELTDKLAVEKGDSSDSALKDAQDKAAIINEKYNEIALSREIITSEYERAATAYGLEDYAFIYQEAVDAQDIISKIAESISAANSKHDTFNKVHENEVQEYQDITRNINEAKSHRDELEYAIKAWMPGYFEEREWHPDLFKMSDEELLEYAENYNPDDWVEIYHPVRLDLIYEILANREYDRQLERELVELNGKICDLTVTASLVEKENTDYENFITISNRYKNLILLNEEVDGVVARTEIALDKAGLYNNKINTLIADYDGNKYQYISPEYKELTDEITKVEKDVIRVELAYNTAEDNFISYALENAEILEEYKEVDESEFMQNYRAAVAYIQNLEKQLDYWNAKLKDIADREAYETEYENYWYYSDRQLEVGEELNYAMISFNEYYYSSYNPYHWLMDHKHYVDKYDELKATRDTARQNLADLQAQLAELNVEKAELEKAAETVSEDDVTVEEPKNNEDPENNEEPTETPAENHEEQTVVVSPYEDLYKVAASVKVIVKENPNIAAKIYKLASNKNVINIAKYVYSKVNMGVLNKMAKYVSSLNINAAIVSKYLNVLAKFFA